MEVRLRAQPSQERSLRAKPSAYPDLKNKWADRSAESGLCSLLKFIVLSIGLFSIFLLVLFNAWQRIDSPPVLYRTRKLVIEDKISYSELLNYAEDFNGAQIFNAEPSTKTFIESILNPLDNAPNKVLSSDNSKGNCWGFEGSRGTLGIRIAKPIYPLHFTVRHANLVNFDSAPRNICIYRASEDDELLGCYEFYISKGTASPEFMQTFECQHNCNKATQEFIVKIHGNHGAGHTCVYQISIHGDPVELSY